MSGHQYGDESDNVIISGYSNANSINHTYHTLGDYIASIRASNNGGQGVDDIHVYIYQVSGCGLYNTLWYPLYYHIIFYFYRYYC